MRRAFGVGVVLLLLLGLAPDSAFAQASSGRGRGFQLKGNYPNPFNPETTISFILSDELFASGKPAYVSIRIYNQLQQLVAIPTALEHSAGNAVPVENLVYMQPGEKKAFWNGKDRTGREVASGIYYYQLVVNGEKAPVKKMVVTK